MYFCRVAKVVILNRKFLKFEIDLDFVLLAITTSLKDYRSCYLINKHLNLNFIKIPDLEVELNPEANPVLFSIYHFKADDADADYYFIANRGTEGYLVPEMKQADYFILIKNYIDEYDVENITSALNKIPELVTAIKIDPKKIKSRENLLF